MAEMVARPKAMRPILAMVFIALGCVFVTFWWQFATRSFTERFGVDAYAFSGLLLIAILARFAVSLVVSCSVVTVFLRNMLRIGWRVNAVIGLSAGASHAVTLYWWFGFLRPSDYSGGILPSALEVLMAVAFGVFIGAVAGSLGFAAAKLTAPSIGDRSDTPDTLDGSS